MIQSILTCPRFFSRTLPPPQLHDSGTSCLPTAPTNSQVPLLHSVATAIPRPPSCSFQPTTQRRTVRGRPRPSNCPPPQPATAPTTSPLSHFHLTTTINLLSSFRHHRL